MLGRGVVYVSDTVLPVGDFSEDGEHEVGRGSSSVMLWL